MLLVEEAKDEKVRLGALELMAKYSDGVPHASAEQSEESEQSSEKSEAQILSLFGEGEAVGEQN